MKLIWSVFLPAMWLQWIPLWGQEQQVIAQDKESVNQPWLEDMVFVEGGKFMMGCSDKEEGCLETTIRQVEVSGFWMGKYEVTHDQWQSVMGKKSRWFRGCSQCPVDGVSWNEVQEFLSRLNEMTSLTFRLPTEAEWEYAARGGQLSRGFTFSGGNDLREVAWYRGNCSSVRKVGLKRPNELGLYDLSGNIWEFCSDWYDAWYYQERPEKDPQGPATGSQRVVRGGCWDEIPEELTVWFRWSYFPDELFGLAGFRLVLSDIH